MSKSRGRVARAARRAVYGKRKLMDQGSHLTGVTANWDLVYSHEKDRAPELWNGQTKRLIQLFPFSRPDPIVDNCPNRESIAPIRVTMPPVRPVIFKVIPDFAKLALVSLEDERVTEYDAVVRQRFSEYL